MDSSVSSIVGALGGGSGVDMVKLATDLSAARFATKIGQLQARNEILETRISAASSLRNQLSQLASALGDRVRTGDLAPQARISNSAVAAVTVQPGASPSGSFTLEVEQLATSQQLVMQPYSSADDLVGEGTLTLRFGTVAGASFTEDTARPAVDIAVTAEDTLSTLAAKINAADTGLTAYVATGSDGAQLVIKGETGAANGFVIEAASTALLPTATPGDLTYLAWSPAADAGELRRSAQDAEFIFDGVAMTASTNDVSDLPGGINLELTGTNIGSPATISFASNEKAITAVMTDLVAALNDITTNLRAVANPLGGELGSDSAARGLKRALASLSTEVVMPGATGDEPRTLGELGLSVNRDGTFRLDDARLAAALENEPEATAAMFTNGLFGVFATLDNLSREMGATGNPGSLAGSVDRYNREIARNDERLAEAAAQQERLRARLTKQFVASDRSVSLSQSTLSFLQSQIEIWNNQRS